MTGLIMAGGKSRRLGQDNEEVYARLGVSPERLSELKTAGVV